jgi:hypothetical protein
MANIIRLPDTKQGPVHRLVLSAEAAGAAFTVLTETKVKRSTRKDHAQALRALKATGMRHVPESDVLMRRAYGEWRPVGGTVACSPGACDHLRESLKKLLGAASLPGARGDGVAELQELLRQVDDADPGATAHIHTIEPQPGAPLELELSRDATGAAYHALAGTKVGTDNLRNQNFALRALRAGCMEHSESDDLLRTRGEWIFAGGVLRIGAEALKHLRIRAEAALDDGVDGQWADGYDELLELIEAAEATLKPAINKDSDDAQG